MSRLDQPQLVYGMYYLRPNLPETEEERLRHRLCMALTTFDVSKRAAKYEADLISSWASMCKIKYSYNVQDIYEVALQKVLHGLPTEHNIKVFKFHVSTAGVSGEFDVNFKYYASTDEQCNAGLAKGKFLSITIFSGRADTSIHLRRPLARPMTLPQLQGADVQLRKIKDESIFQEVSMRNHDTVLYHMARFVTDTADQFVFADVLKNFSEIIKSTSQAQLSQSTLVIARLPVDSPEADVLSQAMDMLAWTIMPSSVDVSSCFVAREGLNGTLVLAATSKDHLGVVGYLAISDHQSGTLLLSVEAHELNCRCKDVHSKGKFEIVLKSLIRRRVVNSALMDDRMI